MKRIPSAVSFLLPALLAALGLALHPLLADQARLQSVGPLAAAVLVYLGNAGMVTLLIQAGAWLLERPDDLRRDVRLALARVGLPAALWTAAAAASLLAADGSLEFEAVLKGVLRGTLAPQLWPLYALFGLALFAPLLRVFLRAADRSDLLYFLGLWLSAVSLLPLLRVSLNLNIGIELNYILGFPGCFLIGPLLLGRTWTGARRWALLAAAVLLTGLFAGLSVLGGHGALREYLFDPLGLHVLLLAACLALGSHDLRLGLLERGAAVLGARGLGPVLLAGLLLPWLPAGASFSRAAVVGLLAFAAALALSALIARWQAGRILLLDYPTLAPDEP